MRSAEYFRWEVGFRTSQRGVGVSLHDRESLADRERELVALSCFDIDMGRMLQESVILQRYDLI